jgi:hypothetical protein
VVHVGCEKFDDGESFAGFDGELLASQPFGDQAVVGFGGFGIVVSTEVDEAAIELDVALPGGFVVT